MKRLFDAFCSLVALLVFGPLLIALWLAVVFSSGLPGLFRQQRVGRGGRAFTLFKFRTMTVNETAEVGTFEAGSTARITTIGKMLRKTKLDEFPQLWNVLKGDMSFVGPRPEVRKWVEIYPKRWANVLTVRPGITDAASIRFRNEEALLAAAADPERMYEQEVLPQKLDIYEEYVRTRSFSGDLVLLFRTLWTIVRH